MSGRDIVKKITDNVFIYKEIIGVEVGENGNLQIAQYRNPVTGKLTDTLQSEYMYKHFKDDIISNDVFLATITIYVTDHFIQQRLKSYFYNFLISTLFLLSIILSITVISINRILNTPLKSIMATIDMISKGSYDLDYSVYHCHELSNIDNSIVTMSKTIKNRESDLLNSRNEIRELQQYLNYIIESLPSMIISVNENNEITQWNKATANFTGIESLNAIGTNIFYTLEFIEKFKKTLFDVSNNHSAIEFIRQSGIIHDNKIFFNIGIYPLHALSIKGCVLRIDDITEFELKEQQLQQTQKIDMIGVLAGGLAHDFNNVLGAICGTMSLIDIKLKRPEVDIQEIRELLGIVSDATKRSIDMVQQLLFLSRKQEKTLMKIDINQVIKNVEKLCDNTFEKNVTKQYNYLSEPAVVLGDNTSLQQVFLNLFINAYHAMTIMREDQNNKNILFMDIKKVVADKYFIKTHIEAKNIEYVHISIRDTGVGMDQKIIAKIFDPFFSTKPEGKGTGLGLSIVYTIVKQHEGFIDVYSEKGIGTTFNIYLPLLHTSVSEMLNNEEVVIKGSGKVLVIDDDEYLRVIAQMMLEECGYSVQTACIGSEGVEIYKNNRDIQLVLLDMNMPEKSGKEVFDDLLAINPAIKVIITSGFSADKRIDETLKNGAVEFLHKPYSIKQLSETVRKFI